MGWSTYDSSGAKIERSLTDFPVGTVVGTARSTTPYGWLLCDGSAVSRSTYADLFAAIGTAYGTGNGSTTFNLPNSDGDMILAVSTAEKFGINDGSGIPNNSITTAKLFDNSITADKFSAALANSTGLNQTSLTNRSVKSAYTDGTEFTVAGTGYNHTDVTGASMSFVVASGAYLLVGFSAELKNNYGTLQAYGKVLAGAANAGNSGYSWSTQVLGTTYVKTAGFAMFPAQQIGSGSQTIKWQLSPDASATYNTSYIKNVFLTVIQVTI